MYDNNKLAGNVDYIPYYVQNTDKEGNVTMKTHYEPNRAEYPAKIPDDSIRYIQEINTRLIPCETIDDRKLIITIKRL